MSKSKSKEKNVKKVNHDLLYIMSNSCGWCKKSQPVVDELINDGFKITKLDAQNPDDQVRINEVKQKYNAQCGTPFFIDAETGNSVCGFKEKDVLEKWANGEEIPKPPQPKTPPPPPPADIETASKEEINKWKSEYDIWTKENDHLPNILPFDQIKQRVQQAQTARKQQATNGAPGNPPSSPTNVGDYKITMNDEFYYVIINNVRETVFADKPYIKGLNHQYFQRESNGNLTKVVGDTNFNKPTTNQAPTNQAPNKPISDRKDVNPQVKSQIEKLKKEQENQSKLKEKKSKNNKKVIKNF